MMDHAITVGDVLFTSGAVIALVLIGVGVFLVVNFLLYRRAVKDMLNRPYDPEEG